MKDCARVLILFITATQAPDTEAFNDYLADELSWLKEMQQNMASMAEAPSEQVDVLLEDMFDI